MHEEQIKTFANPKSASFTVPLVSTKIFAHLISLEIKQGKFSDIGQQVFGKK